ncbi:hypothetical protein ACFL6S_08540 [Candidatus Poribacteria bacterium]
MSSIKESLHDTIELLSDKEARQLLEFAQYLRKQTASSPTLKRLAGDPAFKAPLEGIGASQVVVPAQGKGIAASKLLVGDRR